MRLIDSVTVSVAGAVLKKDMMNPENWEVTIKQSGRSYRHAYTFIVNSADLEK